MLLVSMRLGATVTVDYTLYCTFAALASHYSLPTPILCCNHMFTARLGNSLRYYDLSVCVTNTLTE
jgi:hypothetical protein